MQALVAIAIVIFIAASLLVGVRLLLLYRHTRAWPELYLGGMLLLGSGVGYALRIASHRASAEWLGPLSIGAEFGVATGFSLLFLFTCRVFRPEAAWARVLAASGAFILIGKAVHNTFLTAVHGPIPMEETPMSDLLLQAAPVLVATLWTGLESLRYHGMMRRRMTIGLADVTVTNRFLLWGLMGLVQTIGAAVNIWAVWMHMPVYDEAWILLFSAMSGGSQAVFLVLAFAPPRFYLGWVRARAGAAAGA